MADDDHISRELNLAAARQTAVSEAAKVAAAETGRLRQEGAFCELSYIVGAINEAGDRFDEAHAA